MIKKPLIGRFLHTAPIFLLLLTFMFTFYACVSFKSLPRPLYTNMSPVGGNCTGTIAIDAEGDIWSESGCEARSTGVRYRGKLTPEKKIQFEAALDLLRKKPDLLNTKDCRNSMAAFSIIELDETLRQWYVCVPEYGTPWPEPFAAIFTALE